MMDILATFTSSWLLLAAGSALLLAGAGLAGLLEMRLHRVRAAIASIHTPRPPTSGARSAA